MRFRQGIAFLCRVRGLLKKKMGGRETSLLLSGNDEFQVKLLLCLLCHARSWALVWAENACFSIKFQILQTLEEILLVHREKRILPKFQLI